MTNKRAVRLDGVVVLLDVLGTKGVWKRTPEKTLKKWEKFNELIDTLIKHRVRHPHSFIARTFSLNLQKIAFSDTFIMTASQPRNRDVGDFQILVMAEILIDTMVKALDMGINFRGCISLGSFYRSKRMIIGPAVDEAAEYYTMPEWIGLSAAPSAHRALNSISYAISETNLFLKYDIPLKTGIERNGWALNWPAADLRDQNTGRRKRALNKGLRKNYDVSVAFKFRNTIDFYRDAIAKTKEWNKRQEANEKIDREVEREKTRRKLGHKR